MTSDLSARDLALVDFQFFTEEVLELKLWECQKKWQSSVQTVLDSDTYEGALVLAPADHGKTSRVVIPFILWLLCRDPTSRIILVGNTDSYAQQISNAVMHSIERLPVLKELGLQRGDKWSVGEMKIARPNWREKDPSLLAIGAGAEIQSQRADFIITDDMATRRNSRTESQREALQSYFFTDLRSRLDKTRWPYGGKTFVFGHRVESNDLYSHVQTKSGFLHHIDRAIVDDGDHRVLCPEGHTYEKLCEQRRDDPVGFALMFQQQTVGSGKFITRTSIDACKRREESFIQHFAPLVRETFEHTWLSLDPAFSTQRWAYYTVLTLWGKYPDGRIKLLWGLRDKMSPESLVQLCRMKFRQYMPDKFFIEANQGQTLLIADMQRTFPEHHSKFQGIFTLNKDGELDDEMNRIFDMFTLDGGKIELPFKGPTEQAFVSSFEEELVNFPDFRTRDIIMSTYIGLKGMGMVKSEVRKGYISNRGIVGSVSNTFRRAFR